jgi:hypothetical protein
MSSIALIAANHFAPPVLGKCAAIATSVASAITDLAADTRISAHLNDSTILEFMADGIDIYIAFNNANSGSIDETVASGATSCYKLVANVPKRIQLAKGYTYMLTKAASGTPKVRIHAVGFVDMGKTGT